MCPNRQFTLKGVIYFNRGISLKWIWNKKTNKQEIHDFHWQTRINIIYNNIIIRQISDYACLVPITQPRYTHNIQWDREPILEVVQRIGLLAALLEKQGQWFEEERGNSTVLIADHCRLLWAKNDLSQLFLTHLELI